MQDSHLEALKHAATDELLEGFYVGKTIVSLATPNDFVVEFDPEKT